MGTGRDGINGRLLYNDSFSLYFGASHMAHVLCVKERRKERKKERWRLASQSKMALHHRQHCQCLLDLLNLQLVLQVSSTDN